jgi:hypothetical protein
MTCTCYSHATLESRELCHLSFQHDFFHQFVCPVGGSMLGSKASWHLPRLGTSLELRSSILATVLVHRILQLAIFICCPVTRTCYSQKKHWGPRHCATYFYIALLIDSKTTRELNPNSDHRTFYRLLQLVIFVCGPSTCTWRLAIDSRIHSIVIFVCGPSTCTWCLAVDSRIHSIVPSTTTLYFCTTRKQRGDCIPIRQTICQSPTTPCFTNRIKNQLRLERRAVLRHRKKLQRLKIDDTLSQ